MGSKMKQEKDLALYAPGRSLPPAVRAVFPDFQMTLFSPTPKVDDAFSLKMAIFPSLERRFSRRFPVFRSHK